MGRWIRQIKNHRRIPTLYYFHHVTATGTLLYKTYLVDAVEVPCHRRRAMNSASRVVSSNEGLGVQDLIRLMREYTNMLHPGVRDIRVPADSDIKLSDGAKKRLALFATHSSHLPR